MKGHNAFAIIEEADKINHPYYANAYQGIVLELD